MKHWEHSLDFNMANGSRNVVWCYNYNEPAIINFPAPGKQPVCTMCGLIGEDLKAFYEDPYHKFICRILKPRKEYHDEYLHHLSTRGY